MGSGSQWLIGYRYPWLDVGWDAVISAALASYSSGSNVSHLSVRRGRSGLEPRKPRGILLGHACPCSVLDYDPGATSVAWVCFGSNNGRGVVLYLHVVPSVGG